MSEKDLAPDKVPDETKPSKRTIGYQAIQTDIERVDKAAAAMGALRHRPMTRAEFMEFAVQKLVDEILAEVEATTSI